MQPYFVPYAGYFRLLAAADLFVIYDCVQFPRRGWVHRNRLRTHAGTLDWLTLPLERPPWQARLDSIRLAADAPERLRAALRAFALMHTEAGAALAEDLLLSGTAGRPLMRDYLETQLGRTAARLGLTTPVVRSSTLALPEPLRGPDRILAVCARLGATHYVNAPGGAGLYDPAAFAAFGVALRVLPPWTGAYDSILQRLADAPAEQVAAEIRAQSGPAGAAP
nr:WbqC family protein [Roseospira goensis]